jgi:class II flagellar assembly regulator FliX
MLISLGLVAFRLSGQAARDGETAGWRQILPGRLRSVNQYRTKLAPTPRDIPMRIYGPNGTTLGSPSANVRRTSSSGFSLQPDAGAAPEETRSAAAPRAAGNIDALLALQGVEEDPVQRRKRSVQRGKGALDVLDELKIGLLSGNFDAATIRRLRDAAANLKSSSGDPGLDSVLAEIELRVEVELAKAGQF